MGGPRLTCATEAARAVAERLSAQDTFCLLAFDRTVRPLFGPGLVDDAARRGMAEALSTLRPGVGTALFAALERSYEVLRRVFVRETRPHAVVLTDGYPSVGPSDPGSFAALAKKAADEGIVTSAVGIGLDFDERSVSAIAEGGGGRYSFVDKESDIPGALARHLTDLFSISIENVTLRVQPANAIREASLLHRYPTRVGPDGFVVETGSIGRGGPRRLLFLMKALAQPVPVAATVAITVRGAASPTQTNRIISVPVNPESPLAGETRRELERLTLAVREGEFWDAVHRNERASAERAFASCGRAIERLVGAGALEAELAADRMRLLDQRAVLDGRLSAEAKEAARKRSHQTAVSRTTSVFDPE